MGPEDRHGVRRRGNNPAKNEQANGRARQTARTFCLYLAATYGTPWLALLLVATVTVSYTDTGRSGCVGFPVVAASYVILRRMRRARPRGAWFDTWTGAWSRGGHV